MGPRECGCSLQKCVLADQVGFTSEMAEAVALNSKDIFQLWLCEDCGRVRRRLFDTGLMRFRVEVLGIYNARDRMFEPAPWLDAAMKRMK